MCKCVCVCEKEQFSAFQRVIDIAAVVESVSCRGSREGLEILIVQAAVSANLCKAGSCKVLAEASDWNKS